METQKEKIREIRTERKAKAEGFGLRLTSAIIFAVFAAIMTLVSVLSYHNWYSSSFMKWFDLGYRNETIVNDGTVELIGDIKYEGWNDVQISDFGYGVNDEPVKAVVQYFVKTQDGTEFKSDVYYFSSDDTEAKTATFISGSGETLTLSYAEWKTYSRFIELGGWVSDGDDFAVTVFVSCAGLFAVCTVLTFIGSFVGRKYKWGNVLSIVTGAVTSISIIGIFALVGGIKGYLQLKADKPLSDQTQTVQTEQKLSETAVQHEKQQIRRSEFKLDLYDTNVDEKTWKEFKNTASQDELTVIAIGAKYRMVQSRILNIIYAIGIILSIAIFWPTGGWSLIGYPVFAFLATKSIRYEDTYRQSYRKLSKENKALADGYFNSNTGLKILDGIIKFAVFWLTIPYQAILLLIGTFAPNFVISKNGILVSIPKGYDVGNLGAVGAYYSGFDFIDEALANTKSSSSGESAQSSPTDDYYKKDEYTYVDSHGYTQTIYADSDGKEARDAGGNYVGKISGEGDKKKFTPSGTGEEKDG